MILLQPRLIVMTKTKSSNKSNYDIISHNNPQKTIGQRMPTMGSNTKYTLS